MLCMVYRPGGWWFIVVLLAARVCGGEELAFEAAPLSLGCEELPAIESLALPHWFGQSQATEPQPQPQEPVVPNIAMPQDRLSQFDPLRIDSESRIPEVFAKNRGLNAFGLFEVQGYVWEQRDDALGRTTFWGAGSDDAFDSRFRRNSLWTDEADLFRSTGPGVPGPSGFGEQRSTGVHIILTLPGSSK
jgi:hypothetical protein